MRKQLGVITIVGISTALLFACDANVVEGEYSQTDLQKTSSSVEVETVLIDMATFEPVDGSEAELEREKKGHEVEVESIVTPDHAITLWYVVFNTPSACTNPSPLGPCTEPDMFNHETNATAMWAGGDVSDVHGEIEIEADIGMGAAGMPGEYMGNPNGLQDPAGAFVVVVLKDHGSPIDGRLNEQLTSFDGGCDVNECAEIQMAAF